MKKKILYIPLGIICIAILCTVLFIVNENKTELPVAPQGMTYFGNEATGDLNLDGVADKAFIVTEDPGGSGTFFYVIASLKTPTGFKNTNAIFLGDRIAPQTTEIRNGEIIVNYADRKPTDPMSTAPSVAVSKYFRIVKDTLTSLPQ